MSKKTLVNKPAVKQKGAPIVAPKAATKDGHMKSVADIEKYRKQKYGK